MTALEIFKRWNFHGQKYHRMEFQKPGPVCVAHNHDFAKEGDQPKVMKFSQNV